MQACCKSRWCSGLRFSMIKWNDAHYNWSPRYRTYLYICEVTASAQPVIRHALACGGLKYVELILNFYLMPFGLSSAIWDFGDLLKLERGEALAIVPMCDTGCCLNLAYRLCSGTKEKWFLFDVRIERVHWRHGREVRASAATNKKPCNKLGCQRRRGVGRLSGKLCVCHILCKWLQWAMIAGSWRLSASGSEGIELSMLESKNEFLGECS